MALGIIGKEAMHISTGDKTACRARAFFPAIIEPVQRPRAIGSRGAPDVHFIAFERDVIRNGMARHGQQRLVAAKDRLDIEQAEPRRFARFAFDSLGIGDTPPQQLKAATEAEHTLPAPDMGFDIDVPALSDEGIHIAARRFRARQDNQIGIARQRRTVRDHHQIDVRLRGKRVKIVEIGDMRQDRHRDLERPALAARCKPLARHCIFRGQQTASLK